MTFCYKCSTCEHVFEVSFRRVIFDDREGVVPLKYSDRDSVHQCPNCGADSHFDEGATIARGATPKMQSVLEFAESIGAPVIDMNAAARPDGRRRRGVHRIAPGFPGQQGGIAGAWN